MKIGITVNMSVAFWANGMQQNIVFLYSLLSKLGQDCYYITQETPKFPVHKNHKGMVLDDLMADKNEVLDILIVAGFDLLPEMYKQLKKRNSKMKIILVHYGNKLMDDMNYAITGIDGDKAPIFPSEHIDEIWTSPHYEYSLGYLKTSYKNENVKIVPYIWDSFFVDEKLAMMREKNLDPRFKKSRASSVCIFEPNKTHSKTCLIPVMICERFDQLFDGELDSVNVFCAEKIRERKYLRLFVKNLKIGQKDDFIFFNNRWGKLNACSRFGNTVVSHQIKNELNYSHLECLYLDLPLIHNCDMLCDYGYYYNDCDVDMGAKQLKNAMQNHASVLPQYRQDNKKLFDKFAIENAQNLNDYNALINE